MWSFKDWASSLTELFSDNWILFLGDALVIILAGAAIMFLLRFLSGLQIKANLERVRQRFVMNAETREVSAKKELETAGYKEKYTRLERIDTLFKQAGYLNYDNKETSETILIKLGIGVAIIAIVVGALSHSFIAIAAAVIISLVAFWGVTYMTAERKYVAIEDEMLRFINIADGYAVESNDIVYIIGKVYPNMKEPLYTYGRDFYYTSMHLGTEIAFQHFEERISHKKFREIIHNLYVCSKTNVNYKKVLTELRGSMREYIDAKKERKNISRDKRLDFIMTLVLVGFSLSMANSITTNFIPTLTRTIPGIILLVGLFLAVGIGIILDLKPDKR